MSPKNIEEQVKNLNEGFEALLKGISLTPLIDPLKMVLYDHVARSMEIAVKVVQQEAKRMAEEVYVYRFCSVCNDVTPQISQGEEHDLEEGKSRLITICEICRSVNIFEHRKCFKVKDAVAEVPCCECDERDKCYSNEIDEEIIKEEE